MNKLKSPTNLKLEEISLETKTRVKWPSKYKYKRANLLNPSRDS